MMAREKRVYILRIGGVSSFFIMVSSKRKRNRKRVLRVSIELESFESCINLKKQKLKITYKKNLFAFKTSVFCLSSLEGRF